DSLDKLSEDALSYVIEDNEFKLAKFAYAFSTLMREMNGSVIGSTHIKTLPEGVPAPTIDCKIECEDSVKQEPVDTEVELKVESPEEKRELIDGDAFPQFQDYSDEVLKEAKLEKSIDKQETEPGPSVSNGLPKRDTLCQSLTVAASSKDQLRAAVLQWSQTEPCAQLGKPKRMNEDVPPFLKQSKCTSCGHQVRFDDLDFHIRQFHIETWRNEAYRCSVKECDFRSVVPEWRYAHLQIHHGHNLTAFYKKRLDKDSLCPYCSQ
ncbi:hypothetical protein PENTCL1PPCAC_4792, partial [Pristionchus entomophagus]